MSLLEEIMETNYERALWLEQRIKMSEQQIRENEHNTIILKKTIRQTKRELEDVLRILQEEEEQ